MIADAYRSLIQLLKENRKPALQSDEHKMHHGKLQGVDLVKEDEASHMYQYSQTCLIDDTERRTCSVNRGVAARYAGI